MQCICEKLAGEEVELDPICLGHFWIFQNLKAEELSSFMKSAVRKKLAQGESLFLQGYPAREMFLIKGGRVKLTKLLENGTELTLDILKAADFVGENILSEEALYHINAWCMESTLVCGFSKARFEELVLGNPNIGLQIIKTMSERISSLTSRVGTKAGSSIEDRLYRVLVNVAKEHGVETVKGLAIQFPLTHEEMSFLIGAHRASVSRAIKELKKSGKILSEGRNLILPTVTI